MNKLFLDLAPELGLLCACCAWPPSPARSELVRRAADRPIDWPKFASLVDLHRVAGLVGDALVRADIAVPDAVARLAHEVALSALANVAETVALQQDLDRAGIPSAVLKGVALAQLAYGTTRTRHARDIDIAVAEDRIDDAWKVLADAGYERTHPPGDMPAEALRTYRRSTKDSTHVNRRHRTVVELHWRLSEVLSKDSLPPHQGWQEVRVGPRDIVRTFGDTDLFHYLCLHGTSHVWFRLKWLADVGALLAGQPDRGEHLLNAAIGTDSARSVAAAMMLSHGLFGTALPAGHAAFRSRRVAWLCMLSMALIRREGVPDEKMLRAERRMRLVAMMLAVSRPGHLLAIVHHFALPAEDIALLRIPDRLRFLYPILRLPVWLWKRGARWNGTQT